MRSVTGMQGVRPSELDIGQLEADLKAEVAGRVSFEDGDRALYSTDASNYRQVPICVVVPTTTADVVAAMAVCAAHGAPVLSRGGGTAMAGQSTNAAVVIDFSQHLRGIVSLQPASRLCRVEPGCVLDTLRHRAAPHGLTFGPDPATHDHCTLGGMIGNNSCGTHSLMAGRTSDNVRRLEVLTYDGLRMWVGPTSDEELVAIIGAGGRRAEIYSGLARIRDAYGNEIRRRYPDIPRRVAGYNLDELLPENGFNVARSLVGTEGTCVTVLEAELALVPDPPGRALVVLGYPDVGAAADAVPSLLEHRPIGLEGFDHKLVADTKAEHLVLPGLSVLPDGGAWLIVELGAGTVEDAGANAKNLIDALGGGAGRSAKLVDDPAEANQVWAVREAALGATARLPDGTRTWTGWEDSAVPPARLGDYLRDLLALYDRYGYHAAVYGHFGEACIHNRLDLDLTSVAGITSYRSFVEEAADLCVTHGGSISGEHGDGQSRAELLPRMFGPELVVAFQEFKALWDPGDKMNPGKVVHPAGIDEHLRLGPHYRPPTPKTFFAFAGDEGSFTQASLRCVGVGKCRKEAGGTMCPSYMVTREEKDSTRGRARLLFEMLQGDVITDGWRSEAVRDALDLCLACKGCKDECPVNVDMATYKAEFLAHHYRGRLRPPAHYSMGWLPLLSRVASRAPRLANAATHAPGLAMIAKWAGGIAYERDIPRFARQTFTDWFRARTSPVVSSEGRPLLLWPDSFTNFFHPHVGQAAVRVLEAAGFRVQIPDRPLCCGLTWISTGQLNVAKRVLSQTVNALSPALEAGVPIVVLEPSCATVFRSDLSDLFPYDENAKRLATQTYTLAELLGRWAPEWKPARRSGRAIIQGHCHQKAVLGTTPDTALLEGTGLDAEMLDSGCCGLAGNFGFERGHYEVSMACAERVLLPAVRNEPVATLLIADGFSCRTQIEQSTGRRALHLAEVLDPDAAPNT
jgi:FAD/FMN-containing dehydrogenase/Fe-S oxidoreductase